MSAIGEFLVVAERVIHDSQTANVTLSFVLETISSHEFPVFYPHFGVFGRFRWTGVLPTEDVPVSFRLFRVSEHEPEQQLLELDGVWRRNSRYAQIITNFEMLRLFRPELLTFRLDFRVASEIWQSGPECSVDIVAHHDTPVDAPPGDALVP